MTGRQGRRREQLLNDLNEMREYRKLKEEALGRSVCRTRFRRGCGHVRQIGGNDDDDDDDDECIGEDHK
jgi:hypothetical protein